MSVLDEEALAGLAKLATTTGKLKADVVEREDGHHVAVYPVDEHGAQVAVDGKMVALSTGPFPVLVARIHRHDLVKLIERLPGFTVRRGA